MVTLSLTYSKIHPKKYGPITPFYISEWQEKWNENIDIKQKVRGTDLFNNFYIVDNNKIMS